MRVGISGMGRIGRLERTIHVRAQADPNDSWTARLIAQLRAGAAPDRSRHARERLARLTEREHDVLLLLAEGLNAAAIGAKLYLSESTTKSHIARIYQKLGAANRAQALVTAMRIGLLSTVSPSAR